jgi:ligand-binding sensor domain-containing protein/signal transduction histidine kinase
MSISGKRHLKAILLRHCGFVGFYIGSAAAGLSTARAIALEPTTALAEYGRQSWVMENGLPQNSVHAILQTRDGYLWLGTEAGLARFDGNGFTALDRTLGSALPNADVRCMVEARDNALWIGTGNGLVRLKDDAVKSFSTREGLPSASIRSLAEDADGVLWAWTDSGLARLNGAKFETVTSTEGIPGGTVTSLTVDNEGMVWVATTEALASRGKGQWFKHSLGGTDLNNAIEFVQARSGGLVLAGKSDVIIDRERRKTESLRPGHEIPGSRVQAVLMDREGSLWIGTNRGLCRWIDGTVQRMPVIEPLSSASILSLLEDREGNLWVGTETGGLHILRDQRFRSFGTREGLSSDATTAVVEDVAGTLWVGTNGSGLSTLTRNGNGGFNAKTYTVRDGLPSDVILSLGSASRGNLWVGTPDGLSLIRHGQAESFTSADGLPDDFVRSLLVDADGELWAGTRRGLSHWPEAPAKGHMETYTQSTGLGNDLVGAMARDAKGDLWVATLAGLSRLENGKITNFTTADGLLSDVVTSLLPRADGTLYVGTQDHGWNIWDGSRFHTATTAGQGTISVRAILADLHNHLWFATASGIARCDITASGQCSRWIEFGPADGLRGRETAINSHPSAWRSHDGHLWFATPKGLVEVDPDHFPINSVPPPVVVERFAVDDLDQPTKSGGDSWLKVGAGHSRFQFDYAGLSFVAPQKVHYRYMLDGFDHTWTEAGSRRVAYYTNIPSGRYTFRVQAANNDGLWNTDGANLQFELRPHFYQTIWFYVLLAALLAGLIALVLRWRLVLAEREFKAVLGERSRIAREIHDTLAQGYVGISVQLEVLSELLRQNKVEAAAKQLDTARGHVREGLADARQSIWALRSQDSAENTLPVQLRRTTEQANGNGVESSFSVYGAYRPMDPNLEREFLRVAQEAIHNVKKHAHARHLFVRLDYGPEEIALEIRDDGRGFDVGAVAESPLGHFGLIGMRERAASLGGVLDVTSEAEIGTTVRLRSTAPREAL